jgi:hypothetical protein
MDACLYVYIHTWCARQTRSRSCVFKNCSTMSAPNMNDTPLSLSVQPWLSASGSAHNRSQSNPCHHEHYCTKVSFCAITDLYINIYIYTSSGMSVGRRMLLIWSILYKSGDRPPCVQKIYFANPVSMNIEYIYIYICMFHGNAKRGI